MRELQTLCKHCEQPVAWWGIYGEWRHVGGGRECFQTFAVPGKRVPRWKWDGIPAHHPKARV